MTYRDVRIPDDRAGLDPPDDNYQCCRCDYADEDGDACIECGAWLCSNCYGDTYEERLCVDCAGALNRRRLERARVRAETDREVAQKLHDTFKTVTGQEKQEQIPIVQEKP
jgi:hypothetical protein